MAVGGVGGRASLGTLVKRLLVGRSKPSSLVEHSRLPKILALPIFSSDALSSVAYATEQILFVLLVASAGTNRDIMPIAVAIAALLAVVVASYAQLCKAYPSGGGGYVVSKENLGKIPSLVAASALLVDYVLTVAVSVVAGVVALVSFSPGLLPHAVPLAIGFIALITVGNLRGVRESGILFAIPTYAFIVGIFAMVIMGLGQCLTGCPVAEPVPPLPGLALSEGAVGLFVLLHAFSSGSTALTGVEAIATAVPAFQRPQARNARQTLMVMGVIAAGMFLGISYLASRAGVTVSAHRSVVAQIAHAVFGGGPAFLLIQIFTTAILVLAANTSYQAFPRLLAILARDRYVPGQFSNMGDRLVYSNGVLVLAVMASFLIWIFDANLERLIQLYVVGVFTDFTLSQTGLVRHWIRRRRESAEPGRRWWIRPTLNAVGAVCTATVLAITVVTKFHRGAWMVVVAIPILMAGLVVVNRHYEGIRAQVRRWVVMPKADAENHVLLLVPDASPAVAEALGWVRSVRPRDVRALYVPRGEPDPDIRRRWSELCRGSGPDLEFLPPDGRSMLRRVRQEVRATPRADDHFATIVVPELVEKPGIAYLLGRRDLIRLKAGLLQEQRVVVTDVPVQMEGGVPVGVDSLPLIPQRTIALVFVAAVNDAATRAVNYARSLNATETRAVYFAFDPKDAPPIQEEWGARKMGIPLDVVEAPFRDLQPPMLAEVRRYTARPNTIVTVIMPEIVTGKWRHVLLHNQTPLFVKRLMLFEPRVVLSSVPYQVE
ncbi:MAG: APC family permease [Actinomycetota bacterium]